MKGVKRAFTIICFAMIGSTIITTDVSAKRGCCSWHGGVSGDCRNGKLVCNDGTTSPTCTCEGGNSSKNYNNIIYGCTDRNSINYNPSANTNDGSCIAKIYGCTDSNAYNYNSNANTDDGSCVEKIYGCVDKKAMNYNKSANIADGTCLYATVENAYKKIKYKTEYKYKLFAKKGKVLQKGQNGKKEIKTRIVTNESGEVIESKVISEKTVKKAKAKIVVTKTRKKK